MKITVLIDNTAGNKCLAEHGLSYLVEADKTILFDIGASDLFLRNAEKLNVDLDEVETIVLSHGHDDHTGGIGFLKNKKIICHPDAFMKRYRMRDRSSLAIPLSISELELANNIVLTSKEPVQISDQITLLGEIPRLNDFEAKESTFLDEYGELDFVLDDTGISIKTDKGLVVISGCAHAGICNMLDYAMKVNDTDKVYAVIGGFHLKKDDEITEKTIEYMKKVGVKQVIPSHCTMFPALTAFYREMPFLQVKTGNIINF